MKTHLRKGLAAILCIAMLVGLIPGVGTVTVSAVDNDSTVPQKNADGYYEIGNADQLYWFAQQVNSGSTSLNAVLTADITVNENVLNDNGTLNTELTNPREWTPIGNTSHIYSGTFDGQKHTVSGLYFNDTEPTTGMYVGLFGCNGGTIQKVGVVDSYIKGFNFLGGVCGWNKGIIEFCYNSGKVSASGDNAQIASAGGVCGWNYSLLENCYNIGEVSATAAEVNVGGVCGYNYSDGEISCCYYLESTASSAVGSDDGTTDLTDSKTEAQFNSGEVAYLLQGEQTTLVWGQNIDNGETPDDYPVLGGATVYRNDTYAGCSGEPGEPTETVYSNTEEKPVYADHSYNDNGFCKICDGYEPATLTTDKYDINGDGEKDEVYEIANAGQLYWFAALVNGDKTHAEFDAKNTGAKAVLTADITVNNELLNSLVKDADGKVTNGDSFRSWTPIGNFDNRYYGTFDGQNHTVSGLYFNDTATNNVGLFGYADNGSSVSNVGVVDSYFNARSFVGGVFGCNGYNCAITNCYNTGEVIGADHDVGGVCGYNKNGKIDNCYNTGTVGGFNYVGGVCGNNYFYYGEKYYYGKIDNCYNTGKVSGPGAYVGGVCGYNGDSGTITNCYNTGEVIGTGNYVGGVSGYNRSTITNCYYLEDTAKRAVGTDIGSTNLTVSKTEVQFNSGEVAYLLQSGQTADDKGNIPQVWGQNIDNDKAPDDYPVLGGANVFKNYIYAGCVDAPGNLTIKYSNTQKEPVYAEHNYDNGFCTYCGGCEPATLTTDKYDINGDGEKDEVYEIGNAGQLYWFAQLVNSGSTSLNAVLTADITVNENVLNDNGALNTALTDPREWTPIGNSSNIFTGTFDGQNHTVSGLYFNDTSLKYVGLFGYVNGGSVSDVGVVDSYINAKDYVGGVCGQNSGTIENCYNAGAVSGTGSNVGGVCGQNSATIENCYNTGEVSGTGSNVGGVCGQNSGTITNCYYLNTVATSAVGSGDGTTDSSESKTEAQFKSGEVAYLLQGEQKTQVWGQNIDNSETVQAYPVLGGTKVYKNYTYEGCSGNPGEPTINYSNTQSEPVYADHIDADGDGKCDYCGIVMDGSLAKLAFASLSLKGNIGVSFYMALSTEVIDDSNAYMQFTLPNGSTEKILVSAAEKNTTITEGKTYYVFSCEVAAKEMTADIKAQIISGDSASEIFTYTVKNYADYIMSHTEDYSEDVISLVQAMLNYGAASQEYFDYNTDSLANSSLTDEQKQLPDTQASELSAYAASYTKDESYTGSTSYYGSSLVLKSNTEIKHYFTYDSANTNPDNFVCKDGNGNYYKIAQSGDYLYVRIDNIPAHKLGNNLTLSLYEDDVKVGDISYSPLSYVYSVLSAYPTDDGTHDALRNNVKALYEYYKAAAAYLNVQQSAA